MSINNSVADEEKYLLPLVGKVVQSCQAFENASYEIGQICIHFTDGTFLTLTSECAGYGGETEITTLIETKL